MTAPTSTHRRNHQARRRPIRRMAARIPTPAADRRVALATLDTLCDEAYGRVLEARMAHHYMEQQKWIEVGRWLDAQRRQMKGAPHE